VLDGSVGGRTTSEMAQEFELVHQQNPRVTVPVFHASLSVPQHEQLSERDWRAIAQDYLTQMGFDNNQFVLVRHGDTEHDHVHAVANRVKVDGSYVPQRRDYLKSQEAIRGLEQAYGLEVTPSSWERKRHAPSQNERYQLERTGEPSVRQQLQAAIDAASQDRPPMAELVERLKADGIEAHVQFTRTGKVRGITYEAQGWTFSGTKLGRAYTFPGLQQQRGVQYERVQNEALVAANRKSVAEAQAERQPARTERAARIGAALLEEQNAAQLAGERYRIARSGDRVSIERRDGERLATAEFDPQRQQWQMQGQSQLTAADWHAFEALARRYERRQERQQQQAQQREHGLQL